MAITVSLQHALFQLGAGGVEGDTLTTPSGTWATGDGALFLMCLHHNSGVERGVVSLSASGGALNTPVFSNVAHFPGASYQLDGGSAFAQVTTGFTGTFTCSRTADTADQWLTGGMLKLTGYDTVSPIRQTAIGGDAVASTDITTTLASAPLSTSLLVAICVSNNNTGWNLSSGWDAKSDLNEAGWGGSHSIQWKNGSGSTTTTFTKPVGAASSAVVIEIAAAAGDVVTPDATVAPFPRRTYFILQ